MAPHAKLISLSLSQREPQPEPAVDRERARTRSTSPSTRTAASTGDYLLFLGRMSPDKGAHRAVDDRARGRAAAEDRGQVRRAGRAGVLRRARRARTSAAIASTSAR